VVANADDPLVVWAANAAPTRTWVAAGLRWRQDSTACPQCGGLIQFSDEGWSSDCGLRRPVPDWLLADGKLRDPEGTLHDLELRLPGPFNRGNAALATAAAADFGVPAAQALAALAGISAVEGRYLEREYRGRRLRLLLAKNPAGWQEALSVVAPPPAAAVVSVNARAADGRDPAWLWDVQFELLAGRYVVATGERARDVAVRLRYAGVRHTRVDDPRHALLSAPPGQVEVLANYTAFQRLHRMLARG
jgi:UDP-N-acetylmuramyl tripeptide synthase